MNARQNFSIRLRLPKNHGTVRHGWGSAIVGLLLSGGCAVQPPPAPAGAPIEARPYTDSIPGTLLTFEMVPIRSGVVTLATPAGAQEIEVEAFDIGRTEVTWELFDAFTLGLAAPDAEGRADAVARPSDPAYHQPDYGWGRGERPVVSITRTAAEAFAEWLSAVTGERYRLPTEAEWLHAAQLASGPAPLTAERIDSIAWHRDNSGGTTHPVGSRSADEVGLFDLFGNAAEWVIGAEGERVVRGGSIRDPRDEVGPDSRATQIPRWTERDPQLPRSEWWLTDAPFVGFRIVRDR